MKIKINLAIPFVGLFCSTLLCACGGSEGSGDQARAVQSGETSISVKTATKSSCSTRDLSKMREEISKRLRDENPSLAFSFSDPSFHSNVNGEYWYFHATSGEEKNRVMVIYRCEGSIEILAG